MSGTAASAYGSEEPQCYNCGALGHWAVACPEPTRQTPAGLAAWRSSSHARPGSGNGGNRDRRGPPKKHKGPIITKYGPPPGQPPQPHPPASVSNYPPPNTTYHTQAPYPSPGPPPPSGPPGYHFAPAPPGYPPVQPPIDYPPQHHIEPHYPPTPPGPPQGLPRPPPYNYDAHAANSYPHHQPPPPPPSHYGPSPPGYRNYSERGHEPPRYAPPPLPSHSYGSPPPPPLYGHPRGHSHSHPPEHSQRPPHRPNAHPERHRGPSKQNSLVKKNTAPQDRGPAGSSVPIQLPTPLIHSLPPKPPQSHHTQPDSQRGKHHKKNQDRKNRQRGNKQKDGSKNRDRNRKDHELPPSHGAIDRPSSRQSEVAVVTSLQDATTPTSLKPEPQTSGQPSLQKTTEPQTEVISSDALPEALNKKVSSPGPTESPSEEGDIWTWELDKLFEEPAAKHAPDEVGKPLPFTYHENVLLPRKWDAVCVDSDFVTPRNLERYIRPVHETEYWPHIEFDPAFVVDGKFPCGEPIPKHLRTGGLPPNAEKGKTISPERTSSDGLRKRSFTQDANDGDSDARATKRRRPSDTRKKDSYVPSYRRSDNRSRSRDRRSEPRGSPPRSRRSSASSLNSLEAELLGISEDPKQPVEGRSPSPPQSHRREESSRSPQVKRRRPRPESAYSRRW